VSSVHNVAFSSFRHHLVVLVVVVAVVVVVVVVVIGAKRSHEFGS